MLPSGNDASIVLAENIGSMLILSSNMKIDEFTEIVYNREKLLEEVCKIKNPIQIFLNRMNTFK